MTQQEFQSRIQKISDQTLLELYQIERDYELKRIEYQTLIDTNLTKWTHKLKMTLVENGYVEDEDEN